MSGGSPPARTTARARRLGEALLATLALAQAALGARVLLRMARSARGPTIGEAPPAPRPVPGQQVSVVVPVLDEEARLGPCLAGLQAQGAEVAEILVVDGGSRDGTRELVRRFQELDGRVQLLDASPIPAGWNGKAWGLEVGLRASGDTGWLLTVDADVRPRAALARSLVAAAGAHRLDGLSVATQQELGDAAQGLLHPALLTTLVYRFGIPGGICPSVAEVQANGQCCLFRREALERSGGFVVTRQSRCEDITIARHLVDQGYRVGFYEAPRLVQVQMYASWREAWQNWTRSLPMRDQFSRGTLGLLEVTLVQALPLPLAALLAASGRRRSLAALVNGALAIARLGVLAGTARAYLRPPWSYWLSPLCDLPVALRLWQSALRRRHVWRGRELVAEELGPRAAAVPTERTA